MICGTLEYGEAAAQVAIEASVAAGRLKKARGGDNQEKAQPTVRHCRNCGGTGHNVCTCKKNIEISSESNASTTYIGSSFNGDEIEDAYNKLVAPTGFGRFEGLGSSMVKHVSE
jgi:hypothetical protein